jgi:hypothetical protein
LYRLQAAVQHYTTAAAGPFLTVYWTTVLQLLLGRSKGNRVRGQQPGCGVHRLLLLRLLVVVVWCRVGVLLLLLLMQRPQASL